MNSCHFLSFQDEIDPSTDYSIPDTVPFMRYGGRPADPSWSAAFPQIIWSQVCWYFYWWCSVSIIHADNTQCTEQRSFLWSPQALNAWWFHWKRTYFNDISILIVVHAVFTVGIRSTEFSPWPIYHMINSFTISSSTSVTWPLCCNTTLHCWTISTILHPSCRSI